MWAIQLMYKFRDRGFRHLAHVTHNYIYYKYHVDIAVTSQIHPSVRFPHPLGIVVGSGVKIGKDSVVFQNVTLGAKIYEGGEWRFPTVEERCKIYQNSSVIGDIVIGSDTIIGSGSVVTHSTDGGGRFCRSTSKAA